MSAADAQTKHVKSEQYSEVQTSTPLVFFFPFFFNADPAKAVRDVQLSLYFLVSDVGAQVYLLLLTQGFRFIFVVVWTKTITAPFIGNWMNTR